MEQKIRPVRNAVINGIVVPQYVTLKLGISDFQVNVTLNIDEFALRWIPQHIPSGFTNNILYTFRKRDKKGKDHNYVSIRRVYSNLNTIYDSCYRIAPTDLRVLKILVRKAEIAKLNNQINNL